MFSSQKEGKLAMKAAIFPDEQVPASCPLRVTEAVTSVQPSQTFHRPRCHFLLNITFLWIMHQTLNPRET